jgi:hypothetical protein
MGMVFVEDTLDPGASEDEGEQETAGLSGRRASSS